MTGDERNVSAATRAWLSERLKPGNWLDIGSEEEIPSDIGAMRMVVHMFQIAFGPEVRKRLQDGRIGDHFFLSIAQLLQPDGQPNLVRLNEEVRGMATVRTSAPDLAHGPARAHDLLELEEFDLDPSELDAGHFTIFWTGAAWQVIFDLRAGRAKANGLLKVATEFLEAAKSSAERGHARASVDTLFSASELVAKAHLILTPSRTPLSTHGSVSSSLNQWARLGNIDPEFRKLFNRMSNERSNARYNARVVEVPTAEEFSLLEEEISTLNRSIAHKIEEASNR